MLKCWLELYNIDVSAHTTKRKSEGKEFEYLDWHTCLKLLYENSADKVAFGFFRNIDGFPAFYNSKSLHPFVRVWVDIDGAKAELDYPVITGEMAIWEPTNLEIHNAQQRAFVKCVAINWGLGFPLWQKGNPEPVEDEKDLNQRLVLAFGAKVPQFEEAARLHEALGTTKQELDYLVKSINPEEKRRLIAKINSL